jgi:S1-C subfamily serine protease
MKKLILSLTLLLGLVAPASAWEQKAMNEQVDHTNLLLNDNCSATVIDKDRGYVLTAYHCISDQYRTIEREKVGDDGKVTTEKVRVAVPGTVSLLTFKNHDETSRAVYRFKIVASDKDSDLALLQTTAKMTGATAAKIACKAPTRGDHVYAVGNPYAVMYANVSDGIVSSTDRTYKLYGIDDQGDHNVTQHTASIWGGNSGGALYNDAGELIGVNVRGRETLALAVSLEDVKALLAREGLNGLTCE